jgi:hypothetical protein
MQNEGLTMKINAMFYLLGAIPLLASCASQPITLAPVGPNPLAGRTSASGTGHLQVFSSLAEESDDQNQGSTDPIWYQHTDYTIYDARGKVVEHVENIAGHYSTSPRLVSLQPGNYVVRARTTEGPAVRIPVVIQPDRTTRVHLDENWKLPPGTPKTEIVCAPGGYAVGWRADLPSK